MSHSEACIDRLRQNGVDTDVIDQKTSSFPDMLEPVMTTPRPGCITIEFATAAGATG